MGVLPVHVKLVRTPNYGHRAGKLYASNGVLLINFSEVFRIANEIQESLETLLAKPGHLPGNVFEIGGETTVLLYQIGVVLVHSFEKSSDHLPNNQRIR